MDAGAVDHALDALNVSLDHLIKLVEDGGLDVFDDTQLVEFVQGFERLRNRMPLIDHQTVRVLNAGDLPDVLCQSSLPRHVGGHTADLRAWRRPAGSGPPTASASASR